LTILKAAGPYVVAGIPAIHAVAKGPSMFGSDKRKFIATLIAVFAIAAAIAAVNVWNRGYF